MKLWIDDERPMPLGFTKNARTSQQAIRAMADTVAYAMPFDMVSFDHDLGFKNPDPEDTSRRVLLWMIEHSVWPREIHFHTANPVGYDWLLGTARRYAPETVFIDPRNPNGLPPEFKNHG